MVEILTAMDWDSFLWGVAATLAFGGLSGLIIGILGGL